MIEMYFSLSEAQKGIYIDCVRGMSASYNNVAMIQIDELDVTVLKKAIKYLIKEQEMLRTSICEYNGKLSMAVFDNVEEPLFYCDMSESNETDINAEVNSFVSSPFSLQEAPLFAVKLIKCSGKSLLILKVHHLISDGTSMSIFEKKIFDYYNRIASDKAIEVNVDSGFRKFAEKHNKKLKEGKYDKLRVRWNKHLEDVEILSFGKNIYGDEENIGKEQLFSISPGVAEQVKQLCTHYEVTEYMFYLAVFFVLLKKYTRNSDILISSPFSTRNSFDLEKTIGCFVSLLPLRVIFTEDSSFLDILQKVCNEIIFAYKNINYPNNLIFRENFSDVNSSNTVADISFIYDVYDYDESQNSISVIDLDKVPFSGKINLTLASTPEGNRVIHILYKENVFTSDEIAYIGHHFINILSEVITNCSVPICDIAMLDETERRQILEDFNSTTVEYSKDKTIDKTVVELFEEQVEKTPDNIAVVFENESITYAELNKKSNQVAAVLYEQGVR
ncbi:MAG: condensation domain-containing protein, partial [Acutalibacteraceae bacterium]|nr:condensation domain-containing protein [Acutalibacteraceae bacterium]